MGKKNHMDIRTRLLANGISQRQVAKEMGIRHEYFCKKLAEEKMTENFHDRVIDAIEKIEARA